VEINASGKVVMPSFVDCHTHLAYPPPGAPEERSRRGFADSPRRCREAPGNALARPPGCHGSQRKLPPRGSRRRGPDALADFKLLRVLPKLMSEPLDIVPHVSLPSASRRWLQRSPERRVHRPGMPRACCPRSAGANWPISPRSRGDPASAHHPHFRRCLGVASELGFQCKMHADQYQAGCRDCHGHGNFKALSVSHLEQAGGSEARCWPGTGTIATLLACASFHTSAGNPPARALVEAGVPIALGQRLSSQV